MSILMYMAKQSIFSNLKDNRKLNLPKYQDSQNNIGYCHITFTDSESAKSALEMNGKVVDNRYLEIEMARGARSFASKTY